MPLILPSNSISAGGYEVANSLRFDDGSSDYLSRTPASAGNRKTFTFSTWIKRGQLSANKKIFTAGNNGTELQFNTSDNLLWYYYSGGYVGQYNAGSGSTSSVFRDVSAWYHIVLAVDTTQSTGSNRVKIYINGTEQTRTINEIPQNTDVDYNNTSAHYLGKKSDSNADYFDGYMAETVLIDGQQLDPTSFGEFDEDTGIWKPISVSGLTFGTNGFYLPFENSGALGQDDSGNGNNFTVNNLTSIDQTTDTPTNNFATGNPLEKDSPTYSNGNLTSTSGSWLVATSTIASSSGKYYFEVKSLTSGTQSMIGIVKTDDLALSSSSILFCGRTENSIGYYHGGTKYINDVETSYGNSYTTNDIIGVAMDLDNLKLYFSKNGVWQNSGDPTSGATGTGAINIPSAGFYHFAVSTNGSTSDANYGNPAFTISSGNSDGNGYGNFEYAVPSGYYALNTKNLAEFG